MAEFEPLVIEIKSQSTSAVKSVEELAAALKGMGNASMKAGNDVGKFNVNIKQIGESVKPATKSVTNATTVFSKLGKSLARIAVYRILRTAIKNVAQAFQEGAQNAYLFSKSVGGELYKSLTEISSAGAKMKNQLGAAFAGLLQTIQPILLKLIDWVTRAANAISALFGAFNGGTYLKAKDTVQDMYEATKAGAGAAKEWKNQLMGFDEINKLNDSSSSGGSGSSAVDYSSLYSEEAVPEKIKKIAELIQDNIDKIKIGAAAIGVIFAGWSIANLISGFGALNLNFTKVLGWILVIAGAIGLVRSGLDAWENGVNWDNLLGMFTSIGVLVGGLAVVFGTTGAAIGMLIGGIALLTVGIKDWIATGNLSIETFTAIAAGIMLIGGAIAILTGGWIPLVVAAVAAIGLTIYKFKDEIAAFFVGIWETVSTFFINLWNKISTWFTDTISNIKDFISKIGTTIKNFATGVWTAALSLIKNAWTNLWNGIKQTASKIINWVLSGVQNFVNGIIGGLNTIISAINKVSNFFGGSSIKTIGTVSLKTYATGGFPEDGMFMANHGELVGQFSNGRTAVANNEQIVEGIRQGVYSAVVSAMSQTSNNGGNYNFYLDGKELTAVVTKRQSQMNRAKGAYA